MITVFNRREVLVTYDFNLQSDARTILANNKIAYTVKTTSPQSAPVVGSRRGHTGSFGVNQDYAYEYKIYVHKDDFERAEQLIGSIVR